MNTLIGIAPSTINAALLAEGTAMSVVLCLIQLLSINYLNFSCNSGMTIAARARARIAHKCLAFHKRALNKYHLFTLISEANLALLRYRCACCTYLDLPLLFFSSLALVLLMLSFGFLMPVLYEYFVYGIVHHIPTVIASVVWLILATFSFFTGVILEIVHNNHRRMFELFLLAEQDRKLHLDKEKASWVIKCLKAK